MTAGNCLRNTPPGRAAIVGRMVHKVAFARDQFVNQLVNMLYHQKTSLSNQFITDMVIYRKAKSSRPLLARWLRHEVVKMVGN